jgi:hypothetical protein
MVVHYKSAPGPPASAAAHRFFSSLRVKRDASAPKHLATLTAAAFGEFTASIGRLNQILAQGRCADIPSALEELNFYCHLRPADPVADILLQSGLLANVLNLPNRFDSDAESWLPRIFAILRATIRCSIDFSVRAIQIGALNICLCYFFTLDESTNINLRKILLHFIRASHFLRALVYSTDVLYRLADTLEGDHPEILEEWAAKLVLAFVVEGPTPGQDAEGCLDMDTAFELWGRFRSDFYHSDIFSESLFTEFIETGLDLDREHPTYRLIRALLKSEVPTALGSTYQVVGTLVNRYLEINMTAAAELFLYGELSLVNHLSDAFDMAITVVWDRFMFAFAAIYFAIKTDESATKSYLVDLVFRSLERWDDPAVSQIVVGCCHVLTNVVATPPSIATEIAGDLDRMQTIRDIMFRGTYSQRASAVWLFLTMLNETDYRELGAEDLAAINYFLEVTAGRDLVKFIIRTYDALFTELEAKQPEGRPVLNLFVDADGFAAVATLEEVEDDEKLREMAHELWQKWADVDITLDLNIKLPEDA